MQGNGIITCDRQLINLKWGQDLPSTAPSSAMQGRYEGDNVPILHWRLQGACQLPVCVVDQHQDAWPPERGGMLHEPHMQPAAVPMLAQAMIGERATHTLLSFMKSSGLSVRMWSLDHSMMSERVTCSSTPFPLQTCGLTVIAFLARIEAYKKFQLFSSSFHLLILLDDRGVVLLLVAKQVLQAPTVNTHLERLQDSIHLITEIEGVCMGIAGNLSSILTLTICPSRRQLVKEPETGLLDFNEC